MDTLFYENCQFRQQIKQLKQQLLDSESKYNDLLIQYNERDDSEYDTEYSTDSEDYTDESEEESSCESCSDDDVDTGTGTQEIGICRNYIIWWCLS